MPGLRRAFFRPPMQPDTVLRLRGITKRFGSLVANDAISLELGRGEVLALLGENGAGKSTLMNILAGLYQPDSGTVWIGGRQVSFHSPRQAIEAGIGMVHQHFMLVPSQTVTENILLGLSEPRFRMNLVEYERKVTELGKRFGLQVDPRAKIWQNPPSGCSASHDWPRIHRLRLSSSQRSR